MITVRLEIVDNDDNMLTSCEISDEYFNDDIIIYDMIDIFKRVCLAKGYSETEVNDAFCDCKGCPHTDGGLECLETD